jgi:hypothetical protein
MSGTPEKPQTAEQKWRADMLAVWREMLEQLKRIADAAHGPYGGTSQ